MMTNSNSACNKPKRIAYIGPFSFPGSDAPARRVLGIASSLKEIGCEVIVGSGQHDLDSIVTPYAKSLAFSLHALQEQPEKKGLRLTRAMKVFFWGKNTLRFLKKLNPKPNIVIMYLNGPAPYSYLQKIIPWCRRNRIPVIVDVVEWYQPSHLPGGWLGPFHWNVEIAQRYYYVRAGNIITISRYLDDYYQSRNCHTLRMPPTLDVLATEARLIANNGPLKLAYAGFPGKKDLINNVIDAVLRLDPKGEKVLLELAGPGAGDVIRLPALRSRGMSSLPPCIDALGPLPHDQVLELVRGADFVPLLRPPLRYAQAGFPTKVPESLALGTPIMCNITSDLGDHVHDGVEGIVCRDHSAEAFAEGLERALSMTVQQRTEMRQAARRQAEQSFDYRVHAEPLAAFLEDVRP